MMYTYLRLQSELKRNRRQTVYRQTQPLTPELVGYERGSTGLKKM